MDRRPSPPFRGAAAPLLALALVVAACGSTGPTPPGPSVASTPGRPDPTPVLTAVPAPTTAPAVTLEPTDPPEPTDAPGGGTTETEWGTILDVVPEGFPLFPDAGEAEVVGGPVSGAWMTDAGVDDVAAWYGDMLGSLGYGVGDLSSPLEDGSRVLEVRTDLPECRIRLDFRPAGESTIISVLYGAGCAGGGG